ncbi:MAG: hypothetical protein JW827_10540 [Spirochaetes bacterium]|nr:hypothetical protein [Spirochaetota bacterium]
MFFKLLLKINRKVQYRIITIVIIIGTTSYLLDRRSGPVFVRSVEEFESLPVFWHYLAFACIMTLLLFPFFGIIREAVLARKMYSEKIGPYREMELKQICQIFDLEYEVMRNLYQDRLKKKNIIKMIKKYFID